MQAVVQVTGIVQGVGFRPFVYRLAAGHGLTGYVLNRGDAGVEIVVEGSRPDLERFLRELRSRAPPLADIHTLDVSWKEEGDGFDTFSIEASSTQRGRAPSVVPPDVSICEDCRREMADPGDRRYRYFFTTCTNCGPRFTTITGLPYDRPQTTMDAFPMCDRCRSEYTDPADRRYHAQTIACPDCGPQVYLREGRGTVLRVGAEALAEAGRMLEEGAVVAVKGNGGYHLACSVCRPESIRRLRRLLFRPCQPFALMARDLDMVREMAVVGEQEQELLSSPVRPIVLLEKKQRLEEVAPGLHTVGVMRPYTGLHVLLLAGCSHPLVMTSANLPGEPIIYDDREVQEELGNEVDFLVTYERRIAHRCDDSVVRVVGGQPLLIRRSRGYAPAPVPYPLEEVGVVAVGAEMNVTACVATRGRAFLSPYIGNTTRYNTLQFLEQEARHLLTLTGVEPEVVAHDLHPGFATTGLARQLAEEYGVALQPVQHHHAHLAKVLGEHGVGEAVGVAIDGIGYGDDGTMWGGEVLRCSAHGYTRVGHLQPQLMIGGDLATRFPLRMVAAILAKEDHLPAFLRERRRDFPHGEREVELVLQQAAQGEGVPTTSCGRVLDAASALLGLCTERTYEGEPAMRLESHARRGAGAALTPEIQGETPSVVQTTPLFRYLWDHRGENTCNLAATAEEYVARGLAQVATSHARREGIATVALAGGCAYNQHLTAVIRETVEEAGLRLIRNRRLPAGDGGISYGQAVVAGALLQRPG